jgi:hypothetical protein
MPDDKHKSENYAIDTDILQWKKSVIAKRGYYTSKNSEKFIATPYKTEGTWEEIDSIKSAIE